MTRPILLLLALAAGAAAVNTDWMKWLDGYGGDSYQYPEWVREQMRDCRCQYDGSTYRCHDQGGRDNTTHLTYCTAREWMVNHMPSFDLHYLPPASSLDGESMLDDHIAFAMMADNATAYSTDMPLAMRLSYILPYSSIMEARVSWRPLFFAKFFKYVQNASTTADAMRNLIAPNVYANWSGTPPVGTSEAEEEYVLKWKSSTSPPNLSPWDVVAHGYSSCTGWSGLLVYVARAMGIPARMAGTPCWNGGDFAGPAASNPNVTHCWHARGGPDGPVGGKLLNNHNWVEFWDSTAKEWNFLNSPAGSKNFNSGWMCPNFDRVKGCCPAHSAGAAGQDHEIFAYTWSREGELGGVTEGGTVLDAGHIRLSSGEKVSPMVWSPSLRSPLGDFAADMGLRVVNRSDFYRCKQ